MHGGRLKLKDCQRLMCTVGLLLSSLPLDTIMHYLNLILTPYMDQLNSLALQEVIKEDLNNKFVHAYQRVKNFFFFVSRQLRLKEVFFTV